MAKNNEEKYKTPKEYILAQEPDRQLALEKLREIISHNLPIGFEETIQYNMISFVITLEKYPKGYLNNSSQPIPFISIANQRNYIALYHMGVVADKDLRDYFVKSYEALNIGKLDMGKSCIRFKKMDRIPYSLIANLCTKMTADEYIVLYEKYRGQ